MVPEGNQGLVTRLAGGFSQIRHLSLMRGNKSSWPNHPQVSQSVTNSKKTVVIGFAGLQLLSNSDRVYPSGHLERTGWASMKDSVMHDLFSGSVS
jgi:hypothetical protein